MISVLTCGFQPSARWALFLSSAPWFPVSPRPFWHESGTSVRGLVAAGATAQTRFHGWGVQDQVEWFVRAMRSRLPDREASLWLGVCSMCP